MPQYLRCKVDFNLVFGSKSSLGSPQLMNLGVKEALVANGSYWFKKYTRDVTYLVYRERVGTKLMLQATDNLKETVSHLRLHYYKYVTYHVTKNGIV